MRDFHGSLFVFPPAWQFAARNLLLFFSNFCIYVGLRTYTSPLFHYSGTAAFFQMAFTQPKLLNNLSASASIGCEHVIDHTLVVVGANFKCAKANVLGIVVRIKPYVVYNRIRANIF